MVEAIFDWISEMRAGNLGFIIEVPNISLPHLEAWSHIKAWSEKITFEIKALASIRGNTVLPPSGNSILPRPQGLEKTCCQTMCIIS